MINTEKDLDKLLIKQLKKTGKAYKVDMPIGYGFPDVYYVGKEKAIWIEDKVIVTPKCKIKFEAGQVPWLTDNYLVAKTFILLYIKSTKQYLLYQGCFARRLRDNVPCSPMIETTDFNEIINGVIDE